MTFSRILFTSLAIMLLGVALTPALIIKPDYTKDDLRKYWLPPSQFIDLSSGATAHFRDEGGPQGPVVVLIHGGYGALHSWEPWIPFLAPDYRVIRVDLPAHGLTGRIPGDNYSRSSMVEFTREFLQSLGIDRFSMVGHSMGGAVVLAYALRYPEGIESLVLIGPEGAAPHRYDPQTIYLLEEFRRAIEHGTALADQPPTCWELLVSKTTSPIANTDATSHDPAVAREHNRWKADINRFEENRYARILMAKQYISELAANGPMDLEPRLHEIAAPTLILNGRQDTLVPVTVAELMQDAIPNSELILYENVGHMPPQEIPARTARDVDSFIKSRVQDAENS